MSTFKQFEKRSLSSTPATPASNFIRPSRPFVSVPNLASKQASGMLEGQLDHVAPVGYSIATLPLYPPIPSTERVAPIEPSLATNRGNTRTISLSGALPLQQKVSVKNSSLEAMPREDEPLQRTSERIQNNENPTGLPNTLKAGIENLSGISLDDVNVHYNSPQPAQLEASAYAQGTDIHVGPGQEKYLPHEAWHVVQQKQRRVKPTLQAKGVAINDDEELEREADVMGAQASHKGSESVQRKKFAHSYSAKKYVDSAQNFPTNVSQGALNKRSSAPGTTIAQLGKGERRKKKGKGRKKIIDPLKNKKETINVEVTAPNSLVLLRVVLLKQLQNYGDWLRDNDTWSYRTNVVQINRKTAISKLVEAEKLFDEAKAKFNENIMQSWTRSEVKDYEKANGATIHDYVKRVRDVFGEIDELVQEPPVPPKTWVGFMGDINDLRNYHDGTQLDPIPVVWYKQESDYKPIKIKSKVYTFPDGPTVRGRLKKYDIKVDSDFRFEEGTIFKNEKVQDKRTTQVDINYALKQAGANLNGLDGDHVTDLGFGGVDTAKNYWPLKAEINRRPFHGWRSTYGINYIDSKGQPKTAALGALTGKWLEIKDFMPPGNVNVPAEGVTPDEKSGTEDK